MHCAKQNVPLAQPEWHHVLFANITASGMPVMDTGMVLLLVLVCHVATLNLNSSSCGSSCLLVNHWQCQCSRFKFGIGIDPY